MFDWPFKWVHKSRQFYLKVPCLIIINNHSSFQFAFVIDSTIINILSKLLLFVSPSNICSTYIPCNTFNQHLDSKGATVSSNKSKIHSCNFMIPAPLFYEVNDPLLQVQSNIVQVEFREQMSNWETEVFSLWKNPDSVSVGNV